MKNMRILVLSDESYTLHEYYDADISMAGVDIYDERGEFLFSLYENEFNLDDYIKDEDLYEEDDENIKAYNEDAITDDIEYFRKALCIS